MMIIFLIFLIVIGIDLLPTFKKKEKKTLIAISSIFVPTIAIAILLFMKIEMPSFLMMIYKLLESLGIAYS